MPVTFDGNQSKVMQDFVNKGLCVKYVIWQNPQYISSPGPLPCIPAMQDSPSVKSEGVVVVKQTDKCVLR